MASESSVAEAAAKISAAEAEAAELRKLLLQKEHTIARLKHDEERVELQMAALRMDGPVPDGERHPELHWYGNTPLHEACMWGSAAAVDLLVSLQPGVDLAARNAAGLTAAAGFAAARAPAARTPSLIPSPGATTTTTTTTSILSPTKN